jgi:hypothetical protein
VLFSWTILKKIVSGAYLRERLTAILFFTNLVLAVANYSVWQRLIIGNSIILLSPFKLKLISLEMLFLCFNLLALLPLYRKETALRQVLLIGTIYLQLIVSTTLIFTILEARVI